MSAARLREAAALLRTSAEAATPGPWVTDHADDIVSTTAEFSPWVAHLYKHDRTTSDATYIALMAPPVALALADWLDAHAAHGLFPPDPHPDGDDCGDCIKDARATAVADAILGSAS